MPMLGINEFERHGSCAVDRVHISASRTETAVATKRDKLKMPAVITTIHCAAEGRITAIDHLFDVFDDSGARMKRIIHFFIIIAENFLQDVHKTIMEHFGSKENPSPS